MYNLIFEKSALESLNKLEPQIKERIWNKLQQCKENPFRFLEHLEEIDGFKLRVGDYRALYTLNEKDKIIQKLLKTSPLFRLNVGLEGFFNELKEKNILITIATSQSFNNLTLSFKRLKLGNWFEIEKVIYNDGTYPGKPAPDAYILAAEKIAIKPSECLVFEDAVNGIKSAFSAGVKTIVAVGNDERLKVLLKQSGVVKGIHNFTEININTFF